jgi:hypothetical protein
MEDTRELRGRLLPTPFVSSWVGRSQEGDLFDPDGTRRAGTWAHWAVRHLVEMTGVGDRTYPAILLDGQFHAPKGQAPVVRPHLEIPKWVLERPDSAFPDRLAQMGNGLAFLWWIFPEVVAARRSLFSSANGSPVQAVNQLNTRRDALVEAVSALSNVCRPQWSRIESMVHTAPAELSESAAADFSTKDVTDFFPDGAGLSLRVVYDQKLRDNSKDRAARRVGVWQLQGVDDKGHRFTLGALTPRITVNSLFRDPHFTPQKESAAALLVRGLLLHRILDTHLEGQATAVAEQEAPKRPGRLRAVVAHPGSKIPEASVEAAVNFLQTYPDAHEAWSQLSDWARRTSTQLTVLQGGFIAAHRNALRFVQRAEEPERDDINLVLPLGWDDKSRIVRATFSRPEPGED